MIKQGFFTRIHSLTEMVCMAAAIWSLDGQRRESLSQLATTTMPAPDKDEHESISPNH